MKWDPTQYAIFDAERNQPFFDLTARITSRPKRILDIGCGPGNLTASLAQRWPDAEVIGVDSSPDMIAKAKTLAHDRLGFELQDATEVDTRGFDVVVTNATLQWVPTHRELLATWATNLPSGGWLGFQVPANFDAPSHALMRQLAGDPRWSDALADVLRHTDAVAEPLEYLDLFFSAGLYTQAWQTTYLHVLQGDDPVLEWVRGTGLRPVLQALEPDAADEYESVYRQLLREAYPQQEWGTLFPFLRTFVIGRKQ